MATFTSLLTKLLVVVLSLVTMVVPVDVYSADEICQEIILADENITQEDGLVTFDSESDEVGIIFYPGAMVEYTSYVPLLNSLYEQGYDCFLVEMPRNFAFFGIDYADDIIDDNPEIETWVIMGHSLGGAMASSYAGDNQDQIDYVVVLGATIIGDFELENTLTIYGSLNDQEPDYDTNVVVIEGGNHAQFGNYGTQLDDSTATITWEDQQAQAVEAIVDLLD
ncbi:MAG: alpha/beta hydrolase [Clostridia bacterium]